MENYFKNRRSVRKYSDKEISDELLKELFEEAAQAPTTGNMQLYSVVVTRDQAGKEALAPAHFGQPAVTGCKVLLTFCADYNRFCKWCEASDATPGYDNFQSFVAAMLDTTIVAQQFCTAAEMRGLGTCYMGTTTYNAPQIAETLGLPKMVVPIVTVTLGWPEGETEVSDRIPLEAWVHEGKYNDRTPEEVKAFYAEKEAREDSRKFVEENGKKTLAQVFTDVRYTKDACEQFSRVFRDFIDSAGFPFPKD